jgi:hypothetical protein
MNPVPHMKDGEKTMRGLKIKETPILQGMQIYHNFIKPHEGLEERRQQKLVV